MKIQINLGDSSYDILVESGCLAKAGENLNLNRKVFVLTDSGVPKKYAKAVAKQAQKGFVYIIDEGEESKSFTTLQKVLEKMLEKGLSRKDCVVAVGGGVVGDLAGFAASIYMRGIDFYNIPTTLLSQIDSSIGGKTAINFGGVKNIVGAFYQPKMVLIDPDLLKTLPERQVSNGLAEAVKMSLTSDKELFELIENGNTEENLEEIIIRSLNIKKNVVEQDEKESGLRKVLNFGHTIGHGIEVTTDLYHGESVALGMLPLCDEKIRQRVIETLKKLGLYSNLKLEWKKIEKIVCHDKKANDKTVSAVYVENIGSFKIKDTETKELILLAKKVLN